MWTWRWTSGAGDGETESAPTEACWNPPHPTTSVQACVRTGDSRADTLQDLAARNEIVGDDWSALHEGDKEAHVATEVENDAAKPSKARRETSRAADPQTSVKLKALAEKASFDFNKRDHVAERAAERVV